MKSRSTATKKSLIAGVAVAATLAMSGCGSATQISSNGAHLTKATFAEAMSKATSQVRSLHMTMTLGAAGQQISMSSDIAIDDPSAVQHVPASQVLQHLTMAMKATIPGGRAIEMRIVHGVIYMTATGPGMQGTPGKPWTKIDLNNSSNPMAQIFGSLDSLNPAQFAQAFRGISTLTKLGQSTVDGVPVTHYQVSLDTAKAAGLLGSSLGSDLSALPKSIPYDVWLDSQSRPVEIALKLPQLTMEMHFSRWNEPVHIVAPPASQVTTTPAH